MHGQRKIHTSFVPPTKEQGPSAPYWKSQQHHRSSLTCCPPFLNDSLKLISLSDIPLISVVILQCAIYDVSYINSNIQSIFSSIYFHISQWSTCKNTNIVHNLNYIYNKHNGEKRSISILSYITVQM